MKIETKKLTDAISRLAKVAGTRMSLPILSCVKLETRGKTLRLSASNLDEQQTEIIDCNGKLPDMCVSLSKLQHSIAAGETTELEKDGEFLIINPSGIGLGILGVEEFPKDIDVSKMEGIGVPCSDLADCIEAVEFAKSKEEHRPAIKPVHVVGQPKRLYAEATNGYSLAWIEKAIISSDFEILVVGDFCANFCAQLRREGASLMRDENRLLVKHNDGMYVCKIPEVKYPNTEVVKPKEIKLVGEVSISEIKPVIQRGLAISDGRFYLSAKFNFTKAGLWISFNDPKQAAKMDGFVSGEFEQALVAMDMRYVKDIIAAIESIGEAKFKFFWMDELSPVTFQAGDMTVCLMVMRVK